MLSCFSMIPVAQNVLGPRSAHFEIKLAEETLTVLSRMRRLRAFDIPSCTTIKTLRTDSLNFLIFVTHQYIIRVLVRVLRMLPNRRCHRVIRTKPNASGYCSTIKSLSGRTGEPCDHVFQRKVSITGAVELPMLNKYFWGKQDSTDVPNGTLSDT